MDQAEIVATNAPSGSTFDWKTDTVWIKGTDKYKFSIANAGKTNVQLKLTLPDTKVCFFADSNLFFAKALPQPNFLVSRNLLCMGTDTVLLVNKTLNAQTKSWIVNGTTYNNTADSFILSLPYAGAQNITLVIDDSAGCRGVAEVKNAIVVYANPNLDFKSDQTSNCLPLNVNITSSFNLAGQTIKTLIWQLPGSNRDGATTADVNGAYYALAGGYNAQLSIETNQGCLYIKNHNGFVRLGDTVTLGVAVSKSLACLSEPILFQQTNKPLPGYLIWNIPSYSQNAINAYDVSISFRDTGYFNLKLTYDHNGCLTHLTKNNIVRISGLKADFVSDNYFHCEAPHKVLIKNNSDTVSAKITGFIWNVRETVNKSLVHTSTSKDLNFTLTKNNTAYDIELIANAAGGCSDTLETENFIYLKGYDFKFTANPSFGCPGQNIVYTNTTKTGSYYGFDQFSWEFLAANGTTVLGKSADISPTFIYKDTGTYHTKLVAANPLGCNQDSLALGMVKIVKPIIKIDIPNPTACLNDSVLLLSKTLPLEANYQHNWLFTNTSTNTTTSATGNAIKVAFNELGNYKVKSWLNIVGDCNDTVYSEININGLKGTIDIDSISGCSPFIIKPQFVPEINAHFGFSSNEIKYNWSVEPSNGVIINGARAEKPDITFSQDGNYTLILYVSNASGCGYYIRSNVVSVGVKALLQVSSTKACVGQKVQLKDISTNNPDFRSWSVFPKAGATLLKLDSVNRELSFQKAGNYDVLLIVSKGGSCYDSVRQTIEITSLNVDFYASDTTLSCAPSSTLFYNKSSNADSLIWDFGDGVFSYSLAKDTLYTYFKNSGLGNAFDVTLIAKSNFGCADTLTKRKYISVTGPVPDFEMINYKGCNPLAVQFIDKSKNVKLRYMDYGDGSPLDTFGINKHTYTNNTNSIVISYTPILYGRDSTGCLSQFEYKEKVEVYKFPVIKLSFYPDTVVCQREFITVKDTGKYATVYNWFVNDKLMSNAQTDSIIIVDPGLNKLVVIAANNYGCADTAIQNIQAKVADKLIIDHPKILCINKPILFTVTVNGTDKPLQYSWNFDEIGTINNIQTTAINKAIMSYRLPGTKIITVEGRLANGCKVPNKDTLVVFNSKDIPVVEINHVNIDSLNRPEINYEGLVFDYFRNYNVYRNDSLVKTDSIHPLRITYDPINVLNYNKVGYNLSVTDQCETEGKKGRVHSPVILKVSSPSDKLALLEWSYYIGWNRVEKYKIYRKKGNESFQFVDEVFGTIKSYEDKQLCNSAYTYYVLAVKEGMVDSANSNRATITPQFALNRAIPDIKNVSINNNEQVFVTWDSSTFELKGTYDVLKYQSNLGNLVNTFNVTTTAFTDSEVNPLQFHYLYQVKEVDVCGNKTNAGRYGKTILLHGRNIDKISNIFWTQYEQWDIPISKHIVYFIDEKEDKLFIDSTLSSTFNYVDFGYYESIDGFYQYKVAAINEKGDTSFSNLAKVPGKPIFFIPNAFSPNNDGINDKFSFYNLFVTSEITKEYKDFEIQIYNRWGQMVYQSNNIKQDWDGKYLGETVPSGVYLLKIKLTGSDESRNYVEDVLRIVR